MADHAGICFAFGDAGRLAPWNFEGPEEPYSVMPRARMIVNDLTSLLTYAQAGLGLAYVYARIAEPLVESGSLVRVLDGKVPPLQRYTINYLSKRHMPARLRAFIDLAKSGRQADGQG